MPRNITVTFDDGSQHVYQNAPDNVTPQQVSLRAQKEFGKSVTHLDGGRGKKPSGIPEGRKGVLDNIKDTGAGVASALDVTVGGILPAVIQQGGYALTRAAGVSPKEAQAISTKAAGFVDQPFGKAFGVTNAPAYKQEAGRQLMEFVGQNFAKGAKWIADRTGVDERDVANMMQTVAAAVTPAAAKGGKVVTGKIVQAGDVAANRLAEAATGVKQVARNRMMPTRPSAAYEGAGAMTTPEAARRLTTAEGLRRPVQLTKGQATREPSQFAFEVETAKNYPTEAGKPLIERARQQNQDILANFDAYIGATEAERAGAGQLRPVGLVVDKALVNYANKRSAEINQAYKAAEAAGEMEAPVSYQPIIEYIDSQTPTTRAKLAPILEAVSEELKRNDPNATGQISINALENVRQFINKNTQPGTPNLPHAIELKNIIDASTEGAGGELYRQARQLRTRYAREFENAGRVDALLSHRGKTTDRKVALDDVFDHVVLGGSLEEMQTVTRLLKKAGPEGQQAFRELQGQTVQYLRDILTRRKETEIAAPDMFRKTVMNLDSEGKLDYLFGKKGAQELRDLSDTVQAVKTAPPGSAINYSNTSSALIKSLTNIAKTIANSKIPFAGTVGEVIAKQAEGRALKGQVEEALYPNAMVRNNPPSRNAMTR